MLPWAGARVVEKETFGYERLPKGTSGSTDGQFALARSGYLICVAPHEMRTLRGTLIPYQPSDVGPDASVQTFGRLVASECVTPFHVLCVLSKNIFPTTSSWRTGTPHQLIGMGQMSL